MPEDTVRLFVGIYPPTSAFRSLLEAELTWGLQNVRFVPPEKRHATLCFLGAVPLEEIPKVVSALDRLPPEEEPMSLQIVGLGVFPNQSRPQVLWAGLEGDIERLQSLAKSIELACLPWIQKPENKPFRPHITLARFRRSSPKIGQVLEREQQKPWGAFEATHFHLIESRHYEPGSPYVSRATFLISKPAGS